MRAFPIGVVGINHKTAGLGLREEIARSAQFFLEERGIFFPHPTVCLSTCNRTEIYFHAEDLGKAHSDLLVWMRPFEQRLYSFFGVDAFQHLCRVAAGLESAVLGESEIQRQVKVAYLRSGHLPDCLHFAFQKALKIGKLVRSELPLAGGATLEKMVWKIGEEVFDDFANRRILFVGNSETNRSLLSFFARKGARHLSLCTRTPVAVEYAVGGRELLKRWGEYDALVFATVADSYLIRPPAVGKKLIFDLSVPRNVDPALEKEVSLWNIEQIHRLIEQQRVTPLLEKCGALVEENVRRLSAVYRRRLKFGVSREAGEGDRVADIFEAGGKEYEPLEAEAEAGVGH